MNTTTTPTDKSPGSEMESRLSRAAELAEYLRQNPKEAKRDPDDLASRFGLNVTIVNQIRSSVYTRTSAQAEPKLSLADRLKLLWAELLRLADGCVANPFLFQIGAAVLTTLAGLSLKDPAKLAIALWIGLQSWCLLLKPRFRYAAFASALAWGVATVIVFQTVHVEGKVASLPWAVIACLFGMGMAFVNLFLGAILVVLGGSIQIASQRRRKASLSRHDLIVRMFELQRQLDSLPTQVVKSPHPWIVFARQNPFVVGAVLLFLISSLDYGCALAFHIDLRLLTRIETTTTQSTKVGIVRIAPEVKSAAFLALSSMLDLVSLAIRIGLGLIATSWRKVWYVSAGMVAGLAVSAIWALAAGVLGSVQTGFALEYPLDKMLNAVITILVVRFVVGFHRALTVYRSAEKPDEATIVGELIEVRHRLSANPAAICVLVVDAAGSTSMKKDADQLRVEYSFGRYQNWITQIVTAHEGKVEIRTGDGAICAFGSAESALAAARRLQAEVGNLNATENKLEAPFRLRIALHAGLVQADLDKVQFTEVIDVAAHTEKYSPVGGIALTQPFLEALSNVPDLPVCAEVDGFQVHAISA